MQRRDQTLTIAAVARVHATASDVFAFLSAPHNHCRMQVAGIRLLTLDDVRADLLSGGEIALDGPAGIHRVARTRVTLSQPPYRLAGAARLSSGTEAYVSWTMCAAGDDTVDVELMAALGPIAVTDRLALAFGGRRWIRGRFEQTLRRVADELERRPVPASVAGSSSPPARRTPTHGVTQPA